MLRAKCTSTPQRIIDSSRRGCKNIGKSGRPEGPICPNTLFRPPQGNRGWCCYPAQRSESSTPVRLLREGMRATEITAPTMVSTSISGGPNAIAASADGTTAPMSSPNAAEERAWSTTHSTKVPSSPGMAQILWTMRPNSPAKNASRGASARICSLSALGQALAEVRSSGAGSGCG
jgi:hypothetical protein